MSEVRMKLAPFLKSDRVCRRAHVRTDIQPFCKNHSFRLMGPQISLFAGSKKNHLLRIPNSSPYLVEMSIVKTMLKSK